MDSHPPEHVDPADLDTAAATLPPNITLGRQFKVIAFHWLSPGEG